MGLAGRAQRITLLSLFVVTTLLVALISSNHRKLLRQHLVETLASQASTQISRIRTRIDASEQLLRGLAGGPAMQHFLATGDPDVMARRLTALVANQPQIMQARLLTPEGREQLRVDRLRGAARLVPAADLQDKSGRDYVRLAQGLPPGAVALTALEPNREHGAIEYPLRPTIRVLMSVFDLQGQRAALLVLNLDGRLLLPPARIGETELRLLTAEGNYLLHPDPTQTFGLDLQSGAGPGAEYNLSLHRLSARTGDLSLPPDAEGGRSGALAAYQWTDLGPNPALRWLILASLPESHLNQLLYRDILTLAGTAGLLAALAGLLIWYALQRVARRLEIITRAARDITAGRRDVQVVTVGDDEVALLGLAFNGMTRELEQALTQEQRARAELEDTNLELQRSNADLESFARAAAHDLKTPLRALRILPTFIEEDVADLGPPLSQHLHELKTQSERLEDLVDGLLRYSLLGKENSSPEAFDPLPVIERVLRTCDPPPGIALQLDVGLPLIHCVPVEFEIALRNLVQNAIRHHDRDRGLIVVRLARAGAAFRIEVQDDGPGVADAMKAKVLLPLRTGKSKDSGGGTGLGLAFVAKIADRRGGTVELLDAPGRGLIVRLTLPLPADFAGRGPPQGEVARRAAPAVPAGRWPRPPPPGQPPLPILPR
ncbi:sensor histidine kinase [Pseudooceanicola sp. 200-1SW]|uniref:sensor histidine kinase n=1 Tax=Pseudooceanicola sp. 200-1SW TaxID=3425949 RepID=UPI003D7F29C6